MAVAVLAGCSSNLKLSPNSAALLPPPVVKPGPDYRLQLGDTLHISFLYQPARDERRQNRLVTIVPRMLIGAWSSTDCAARFAVRSVSRDWS